MSREDYLSLPRSSVRTVISAVMDESPAAGGAQAAHDSGGGGGRAETQCVVNRAGPLETCNLHNLVRCTNTIVSNIIQPESQLGGGMKAAFLDCVRQEFTSEGFLDIECTDLFLGWSCTRKFGDIVDTVVMGYCIMAKDMGGNIMVVYYTVPTSTSRVGTLGYTLDASKFFDMLILSDKIKVDIVNAARVRATPEKNLDQALVESMKAIQTPKAVPNCPGLFQNGFQAKCVVPDSGHPYSLVIHTVAGRIVNLFTTLHRAHVCGNLDDRDTDSRDFIRYVFRVCHFACNRLDALNSKLTLEGGRNIRSLEYFNIRRFSNHSKREIPRLVSSAKPAISQCIQDFIKQVDRLVYSIFHQSRGCLLFLTAGKALTVETEREIRSKGRQSRRRMEDDDTDDGDEDEDEDETDPLIFKSLEDIPESRKHGARTSYDDIDDPEECDAQMFNSHLIAQLPQFFNVMSSEITSFTRTRVLEMFNSGTRVQDDEAQNLLLLAETVKTIHVKTLAVKDRILAYTFIPDFLYQIISAGQSCRQHLDPFRKHLEVVQACFPNCVWTSPVVREGSVMTIMDRLDLFRNYLSGVTQVHLPPVSEQISACQKILSFFGVSCDPAYTVVTAVRLINEGRLGTRGKSKQGAVRRVSKAGPNALQQGQETAVRDFTQAEGADATESTQFASTHRRSNASGGDEATGEASERGAGSRTRSEVDTSNVINSGRTIRSRGTTKRFSYAQNDGTMLKRPKAGFENPELVDLRKVLCESPGASASRNRGTASVPVNALPSVEFLCPDHRDVIPSNTEQKFVVPFVLCIVVAFAKSPFFPDRELALIHYKEGASIKTIVDVLLLLHAQSNAGKRQVGVRIIDGDTYVYNVNVVRSRRPRPSSSVVATDRVSERQESDGPSFNFVSAAPTETELEGLRPPRTALGISPESTAGSTATEALDASVMITDRGVASRLSGVNRIGLGQEEATTIENPLHCGKIYFAKHDRSGQLVCITSERLYTLYSTDTAPKTRRRTVQALNRQSVFSDEIDQDDENDDADYSPSIDMDSFADSGGVAPVCQPMATSRVLEHANVPWESFEGMKLAAERNGWTMLNPVGSFIIIYNPADRTVAVIPTNNLTKAGKICVYAFLNKIDPEFRTIYGPFYLQFQDFSIINDLLIRPIMLIISNVFNAEAFKVFTTQKREDGKIYLVESNEFLDTYLETVLPDYHPDSSKFVSLFQLCPYNFSTGDPMIHENLNCCFRLDASAGIDTTLLSERMYRHQRAPRVITNANVCYMPCPGCQCLFHDIAERNFCVSLLGRDDPRLDRVVRKGQCVYAVEKAGNEYKWFTIESSHGSRKKRRETDRLGTRVDQARDGLQLGAAEAREEHKVDSDDDDI